MQSTWVKQFLRKMREVLLATLPLASIIIIICFAIFPMSGADMLRFGIGYVLIVLGQTIFLLGVDYAVLPMGTMVGKNLPKLKKAIFIVMFGFLFGTVSTVAEPSVSVISAQLAGVSSAINPMLMLWLIGFSIGAFFALALYRIIKNFPIKYVFIAFYAILIVITFFVPNDFVGVAFDATGDTTGDVSVPFMLAIGAGVSLMFSKSKNKSDDTFGLIGTASIGPIFIIYLYAIITGGQTGSLSYDLGSSSGFFATMAGNLLEVLLATAPILVIFLIFQFAFIRAPKKQLLRIMLLMLLVFAGLLLFLTGVAFGLQSAGQHLGKSFMDIGDLKWFLIPLGFVIGFVLAVSEPAVRILGEQVHTATEGTTSKWVTVFVVALGVALACALSMLRTLTQTSFIYYIVPMYVIIVVLSFFCPKMFVGLSFDSGGAATGAVTAAFITPVVLGICQVMGLNALEFGFGTIGMMSSVPIITIQVFGIIYRIRSRKKAKMLSSGAGGRTCIGGASSRTRVPRSGAGGRT